MAAAAGACSLSGLSDGAGAGPPLADGGSISIESGSAPPDAGAQDPTSSWCTHTFCDDFDHLEAGAFATWDRRGQPLVGIAVYPDASASAPNSADILCDGVSTCWMTKTFPAINGMKFQLHARLVSVNGAAHAVWEVTTGEGVQYATVRFRDGGTIEFDICDGQNCPYRLTLDTPLSTTTFQKISGEISFANGGRVNVSIDDKPAVSDAGPLTFNADGGVIFGIGDVVVQQAVSSEILIDDVVIDTF